jgi:hypothetical protein
MLSLSNQHRAYLVPSAEFEGNVLTDSCSGPVWSGFVALFLTKLRPLLPLSNRMVDELLLQRALYPASNLERPIQTNHKLKEVKLCIPLPFSLHR